MLQLSLILVREKWELIVIGIWQIHMFTFSNIVKIQWSVGGLLVLNTLYHLLSMWRYRYRTFGTCFCSERNSSTYATRRKFICKCCCCCCFFNICCAQFWSLVCFSSSRSLHIWPELLFVYVAFCTNLHTFLFLARSSSCLYVWVSVCMRACASVCGTAKGLLVDCI